MPILIGISGALGIIMAALYYPHSPVYLFGSVELFEVWLWAKYSAFLGAISLVFILLAIDQEPKGQSLARSLSIFVMTLQGMLQLPAIALYFIFLHGASVQTITVHDQAITITMALMFFHLVTLLISSFSAAWIGLVIEAPAEETAGADVTVLPQEDLTEPLAS